MPKKLSDALRAMTWPGPDTYEGRVDLVWVDIRSGGEVSIDGDCTPAELEALAERARRMAR